MNFKWRNWLGPNSQRQGQMADPTRSFVCPLFTICLACGEACHLSPARSPPPPTSGPPAQQCQMPSGAWVRPLLCVCLAASLFTAKPRWARTQAPADDVKGEGSLGTGMRGNSRDGHRQTDFQTLAVHPGLDTVPSAGLVLSLCGDWPGLEAQCFWIYEKFGAKLILSSGN